MNNKKTTLLASMLLCGCVFGYAQRTPTHPLDIRTRATSTSSRTSGTGKLAHLRAR